MTAFQGAATFGLSGSLSATLFSRQTAIASFNPAGNLVGRSFFDSLFTDSSRIAFSNNFLTVTAVATGLASTSARSNAFNSSAYPRLYCSATVNLVSGSMALGICNVNQANTTGLAASANAVGYFQDGTVKLNSVTLATIQTYATADVISMAVDFANNKIWFRKGSNNWNNNVAADPSTNVGGLDISGLNPGPYYVAVEVDTIGDQITLDFLGFDPATIAWVNAVVAAGGTVSAAEKSYVDVLINGLKSDGLFTKLDRLWLYAVENTTQATFDIITVHGNSPVGSPAFQANRGYTGVDASSTVYIDLLYSQGNFINYSQNSAHISSWQTGNVQSSASGGAVAGFRQNYAELYPRYSDGNAYFRINDASGGNASTNSTGHFIANRTGASLSQGYVNGALFANINATSSANTLNNLYSLATNIGGNTSGVGSANQVAMVSAGGGFSATDVANFYNRISTYLASVFTEFWTTNVVTNGGTVSVDRKALVSALIKGLMTDGVWFKLDRLWLLAAENAGSALTDIVKGSLATAVNSPTFTANRGYSGFDATVYIDSNFNPVTAAGNATQNSMHGAAWVETIPTNDATQFPEPFGSWDNGTIFFEMFGNLGAVTGRVNDNTTLGPPSFSIATGLWAVSRTTATARSMFFNDTEIATNAGASTGLTSQDVFIGVRNDGGSPGSGTRFLGGRLSSVNFGGALTSSDVAALYARLRSYLTSVGVS